MTSPVEPGAFVEITRGRYKGKSAVYLGDTLGAPPVRVHYARVKLGGGKRVRVRHSSVEVLKVVGR